MSNRIYGKDYPAFDENNHTRAWIGSTADERSDHGDDAVAYIELAHRDSEGKQREQHYHARLSRAETREVIEVLQEALDQAGPEPIVEPEGLDYLIDKDGAIWHRKANGRYNMTPGESWKGYMAFEDIVKTRGPVATFQKTEDIELGLVSA